MSANNQKVLPKGMAMSNASEIAKLVINTAIDKGINDVSNIKLQKLLYYCQGYSLALSKEPMFDDNLVAWDYGPVVSNVYHEYKGFGDAVIPRFEDLDLSAFSDAHKWIVDFVVEALGSFRPFYLVDKTHREMPWKSHVVDGKADGSVINFEEIESFFGEEVQKNHDAKLARLLDLVGSPSVVMPNTVKSADDFLMWIESN